MAHRGYTTGIIIILAAVLVDGTAHITTDENYQQPAQMTHRWWDLHYQTIFKSRNITGDPRKPGFFGVASGSLSGGLDKLELDTALDCVQVLLEDSKQVDKMVTYGPRHVRKLRVVVLGCGLSPLVWALAELGGAEVICLEVSSKLIEQLDAASLDLPRPPRFVVGDIGAIAGQRRMQMHHRDQSVLDGNDLVPHSVDLVVDENVIDGMACQHPPSARAAAVQKAFNGVRWLLQPQGRLLSLSFLSLDSSLFDVALADWVQVTSPCKPLPSGHHITVLGVTRSLKLMRG